MPSVSDVALTRLTVALQEPTRDPRSGELNARLQEFDPTAKVVAVVDVYTVVGRLTAAQQAAAADVLANPVFEQALVNRAPDLVADRIIEIGFRPGVTDNVGGTAAGLLRDLGASVDGVYTSRQYWVHGAVDTATLESVAAEMLYNKLIQHCEVAAPAGLHEGSLFVAAPRVTSQHKPQTAEFDLNVSDGELLALNSANTWALQLEELRVIRDHFNDPEVQRRRSTAGLPTNPTDVEVEALAQTWSEHCKHKIFNATIEYTDEKGLRTIKSLFKTYVRASTEEIAKQRDWLVSVFTDNAGIIKLTDDHNLVMKVETHNSPSALDPYGGSITGILGCNRDTVGTGRAARPIFNTDVFCFGDPNYDQPLPPRVLHPRRIFEQVRRGVEHGGNKMGIPTVNGSVVFDNRFMAKPMVYCGTGGIIPAKIRGQSSEQKPVAVGDMVIMAGGRIGKDGIHGATFSSEENHEDSPVTAVQIGDPITQKNLFDFILEARDLGLYKTLTDNGAGGLSSSVFEMAELSGGCVVNLEQAPLKYPGLDPWEILVSESQERMTLVVDPANWEKLQDLARRRNVEVSNVGEFNDSGVVDIRYDEKTVGLLDLEFLHNGLPEMKLRAHWEPPVLSEPTLPPTPDFTDQLKQLLGRLNICSKEKVVRQYDHEVQGTSVVKPLTGAHNDGPSDAGVIKPLPDSQTGVVISHGIMPRFSDIDTYHMTANVIDEAIRNAVATGANPNHLAGLDNFCWCDPVESPTNQNGAYKLAQLVRSNQALYDYTVAFGVPCISGKDSMKNDYTNGQERISIPPTLLFTIVGKIDDVRKAVTMDAKRVGDLVYVLGQTHDELGGSEYYAMHDELGANVPKVDARTAAARYQAVATAMRGGLVASAHDCSDGGLAVTLAETAFAGGLGLNVDLAKLPTKTALPPVVTLFSESASRLVVTVNPTHQTKFEAIMTDTEWAQIGTVTQQTVTIRDGDEVVIEADQAILKAAWQGTLGV